MWQKYIQLVSNNCVFDKLFVAGQLGYVDMVSGEEDGYNNFGFLSLDAAYDLSPRDTIELSGYLTSGTNDEDEGAITSYVSIGYERRLSESMNLRVGAKKFYQSYDDGDSDGDKAAGLEAFIGLRLAFGAESKQERRTAVPFNTPDFYREISWADEVD